ncbi:MAG: type IX secretion system motor protein PorM/GldM [Bacteroidia bacterium]
MASGKLTPRQKMINLMYLVLTALLALNVSAEVLQAFQNLADSLRNTADKLNAKNQELMQSIKDAVKKEMETGNKKNEYLITEVDFVRRKTDSVINILEGYIEGLYQENVAGRDPETGRLKRLDEREYNYRYWMGKRDVANEGRGEGKAYEMHKVLDAFVDWANQYYAKHNNGKLKGSGFQRLCIDPKDNPYVKERESKDKTWEYFTFHMTPAVANLATLEKFKNDVYVIEADLLELLKTKLSQVTFKIDSLILVSAPKSEIVVAGMKFETKVFVAATSQEARPTFSGTGSMKLESGGNSAIFTIPASAAVIPRSQRKGKQNYTITAQVPKADGTFAQLRVNGSFEVVKPEIQITSASVQLLYAECGNDLNIDVPALGELYNPVVVADNAQVLQSKESKKKFRVVPRGGAKTCVLTVKTNTAGQLVELGKVEYRVVPPPRPSIKVEVDGQVYNGVSPVSPNANVKVKIVPDRDFATALPQDARYTLSKVEILVQKGLGGAQKVADIAQTKVAASPTLNVDLSDYSRGVPAGSKVYVRIGSVDRVNFQNKQVPEFFNINELTTGITLGK